MKIKGFMQKETKTLSRKGKDALSRCRFSKKGAAFLFGLSALCLSAVPAFAEVSASDGEWVQQGESWYFIPLGEEALKDDWAKIDGRWYHFSKTGEMEKGWILDQGRSYYFAGDGGMLSWQWLLDQGKWYFLGEDGGMLANQWLFEGGKWYFLNSDGSYNTNSGA